MSTTVNDPAVRAAAAGRRGVGALQSGVPPGPARAGGAVEAARSLAAWEDEGGPPPIAPAGAAPLDWEAFAACFWPGAHRHRYAPLAAYVAYRAETPSAERTR